MTRAERALGELTILRNELVRQLQLVDMAIEANKEIIDGSSNGNPDRAKTESSRTAD